MFAIRNGYANVTGMTGIPLEDGIADVLGKALTGSKLSPAELAKRSGLAEAEVQSALDGDLTEARLDAICPLLGLSARKLKHRLAATESLAVVNLPDGAAAFNMPFPIPGYEEMTVNAYLIWNPSSRQAIAFDCGGDATPILNAVHQHNLSLEAILLTHTHKDHIAALDDLRRKSGNPAVWVHHAEAIPGADTFTEGKLWQLGSVTVRAANTHGHSPGGTTYCIDGLALPIAIVGDAVFADSVGGAPRDWNNALDAIRRAIFSLPDATILCPGHGPLTTVGAEKRNNPFFPEFS